MYVYTYTHSYIYIYIYIYMYIYIYTYTHTLHKYLRAYHDIFDEARPKHSPIGEFGEDFRFRFWAGKPDRGSPP